VEGQNQATEQRFPWLLFDKKTASSGMLRRVALVRTDVSEQLCASIIRVTRIGELGTTLAYYAVFHRSMIRLLFTANVVSNTPILVTLMTEAIGSSKRRFLQESFGTTSQRTALLIVTALIASDLT
jgi:hypothetical protein